MIKIETPGRLGQAIKEARQATGMRQEELADMCGVGRRFLVELEAGKQTAEIGKALKVAHGVGIDIFVVPRRA